MEFWLFQVLKDDAVKVLHSICQQIWKTQQWSEHWNGSVSIPPMKKNNGKNVQTTTKFHSFHMLVKLCSKSFKLDFKSMWIENFQMYKLDLEKERNQISNWIMEKAREFQKNIYFWFTDYVKVFVWITANCGKFLRKWEYQTTLPASWETSMWLKKQ